ncbi:UrcA family protein [Sphingobium sp. CCH11-B1]|jgi:UrcA family protein|uniref:UrcA family protein n=1 Tax=Sphingobium sp. CCH11-B1 TaxID=1768781 RepID=UPI0008316C8C|nr:UrcA family protein [Sphingobium sp. CCH11-B1]MEA3389607.1 UrcA family protein [Pseudomonadota bacterium]
MTKKTLAVLAASMALALPGLASAGSSDMDVIVDGNTGAQTRSIAVSVADLNLASDSGLRRADYRLVRASKQVCGYVNGSILPVTNDYRNCYGSAIQGARADLNTLAQRLG